MQAASAATGFAVPRSDQECPPGPSTSSRSRLEPIARCTIRRIPEPSSATNAAARRSGEPSRKRCFTPRRSPIPSSPTLATKSTGRSARASPAARMRATASIPASPRQLSVIPGARMRRPSLRGSTSVPSGKTVSRCAATTTGSPPAPAGAHVPSTLPTSSSCTSARPMDRKRSRTYAPRSPSPIGGAGMRTSASCSSSVSASVSCARRRSGWSAGSRVGSLRGCRLRWGWTCGCRGGEAVHRPGRCQTCGAFSSPRAPG